MFRLLPKVLHKLQIDLQHIQDNNHIHQLLIVRCHNKLVSEITICVKANNDVKKNQSVRVDFNNIESYTLQELLSQSSGHDKLVTKCILMTTKRITLKLKFCSIMLKSDDSFSIIYHHSHSKHLMFLYNIC